MLMTIAPMGRNASYIGKNFANEGFYLSLFSVDRCIDSLHMNFVTYM